MLRMRTRCLAPVALTLAAGLFGGAAWAALFADNVPVSVLADGGFDDAELVLRLDDRVSYPLIAGGWGVRGSDGARVQAAGSAAGGRALEIEAGPGDTAQAVQDVPLASRAFVLDIAFQRVRGRQRIELLSNWDRLRGHAADGVTFELAPAGLAVVTAAGRVELPVRLQPGAWVRLNVVSDPRDGQLRVSVDDQLVGVVPGVPASVPTTLLLGTADGRGRSLVRYDDIALFRLAEVELAQLRLDLQREAPVDLSRHLDRVEAAARALHDGAAFLALPEIRAVARALERGDGAAASPAARGAFALVRLLEGN